MRILMQTFENFLKCVRLNICIFRPMCTAKKRVGHQSRFILKIIFFLNLDSIFHFLKIILLY